MAQCSRAEDAVPGSTARGCEPVITGVHPLSLPFHNVGHPYVTAVCQHAGIVDRDAGTRVRGTARVFAASQPVPVTRTPPTAPVHGVSPGPGRNRCAKTYPC